MKVAFHTLQSESVALDTYQAASAVMASKAGVPKLKAPVLSQYLAWLWS